MELTKPTAMSEKIGRALGLLLLGCILLAVLALFVMMFNDAPKFFMRWSRLFPTETDVLLNTRVALYVAFAPGPCIGIVAVALLKFTRGWKTLTFGALLGGCLLVHILMCYVFGSALIVFIVHQVIEIFLTWKIIRYLRGMQSERL